MGAGRGGTMPRAALLPHGALRRMAARAAAPAPWHCSLLAHGSAQVHAEGSAISTPCSGHASEELENLA